MKQLFFLFCFVFGLASYSYSQQKKTPPKVNLENFQPPKEKNIKKEKKSKKMAIPKVDISNFKPPKKEN
ncbi:hypothetical protein EXU57_01140 [Segetibacter sp. 3557_3]|uniref:hypothetical protein n=1 Tax=Segetibacter sp. 3557_3 TaxID=2547429 RepID=UPI0010590810|nr:hypothetical protein [Segetibacter sp. 3557_3]TDH28711.1 hypothetical protein EXU57_01140 [Segetibacter sp. 3557_3]